MFDFFSSSSKPQQELQQLRQLVAELQASNEFLRQENTSLRQRLERLSGIEEENQRLRERIETLAEKTRTNSRNSSTAPSQDPHRPQKKRRKIVSADFTRRKAGPAKESTPPKELKPVEEVDHLYDCIAQEPCFCGGRVEVNKTHYRREQQYEIPQVEPEITEFRIFSGECVECGRSQEGHRPPGVPGGMLGIRALAQTATLSGDYQLSKRETQRVLADSFGIKVSLGTVSNAEAQVSAALAVPVEEAHTYVQQQERVNADETSHRQAGKKQWLWVAVTTWVSVFLIQASRSTAAAKKLLGETFKGILGSDRYGAYNWVDTIRRQLCWAHLIRDFIKISERSGAAKRIGNTLLAHAKRMFKLWYKLRDGTITRKQFQDRLLPLRKSIERLLEEGVETGDSTTAGTCQNILKFKAALWTFVEQEGVEPTNNAAERAIRPYVLWRRKSFGSQSERGNRFIERMCTVKATCRQQSRDVLDFITEALRAHLAGTPAPSLLPQRSDQIQAKAA